MSKSVYGMVLTHRATFANNRGESEGNTTTLQKVFRDGGIYTTVSPDSIRYAIREEWQRRGLSLNRTMLSHKESAFADTEFESWVDHIDDDILGYANLKNESLSRRGLLEVSRAISTTCWLGEVMHNFASPGSNPSVTHQNPIPYSVEVHDTRYQFGFAITPVAIGREGASLEDQLPVEKKHMRLRWVLEAIRDIRRVGGNHARYFADYSPEVIVLRWTDDPAPRFLYCFEQGEHGEMSLTSLIKRIKGGDIDAKEMIVGTALEIDDLGELKEMGVTVKGGAKEAVEELLSRVEDSDLCPNQAG